MFEELSVADTDSSLSKSLLSRWVVVVYAFNLRAFQRNTVHCGRGNMAGPITLRKGNLSLTLKFHLNAGVGWGVLVALTGGLGSTSRTHIVIQISVARVRGDPHSLLTSACT